MAGGIPVRVSSVVGKEEACGKELRAPSRS